MMADHAVWWTAEDKALALLKSWLSPEQLEQYELFSAFDVTGSDTGKRYRIRHGKAQNVYELDGNGNAISGLCFWPGQLPAGDCMLAQKIALETRESEALAVANRFGVFGAGAREATARQLIYLGFESQGGPRRAGRQRLKLTRRACPGVRSPSAATIAAPPSPCR